MNDLEHNIKAAFAAQDAKSKLANKDAMWNRLDSQMGRKGVAAFWRVAALFIGFLLFTGAFAALNNRAKQNDKLEKMEIENARLSAAIDSLSALPAFTETEIQIVEKEKIVYRDRMHTKQNIKPEKNWEKYYCEFADSTALVLAQNEKDYKADINKLKTELAAINDELSSIQKGLDEKELEKQTTPFELKSERIELDVQKKPSAKTPEMEMKVFQKNFIENRNNLNSTIFKK